MNTRARQRSLTLMLRPDHSGHALQIRRMGALATKMYREASIRTGLRQPRPDVLVTNIRWPARSGSPKGENPKGQETGHVHRG